MAERTTRRDVLRQIAWRNHGLFTTSQATEAGVPLQTLATMSYKGHLTHIMYGLYFHPDLKPGPFTLYAEALFRTKPDSYLTGESALALFGLADPGKRPITVSGRSSRRANEPDFMEFHSNRRTTPKIVTAMNLRCTTVAQAILDSGDVRTDEQLESLLNRARSQRLITKDERQMIVDTLAARKKLSQKRPARKN